MEQTGNRIVAAFALRIEDLLRPAAALSARCRSCGHETKLDPAALAVRTRGSRHTRLVELEDRRRCSRYRKGFAEFRIVRRGKPAGPLWPA